MTKIEELEKGIKKIKERNEKVEADKTWEICWTRKILIFVFTYIAITVYFYVVGISKPFLNAIVPAVAFIISTLTLPYFKKIWLKHIYKK